MALTPIDLYDGQPGTSIATLRTLANKTIVKDILIHNTTAADARVELYFVRPTKTAVAATRIVGRLIKAEDTLVLQLNTVLPANTTIQGVQTTAGAITLNLSGVEVV